MERRKVIPQPCYCIVHIVVPQRTKSGIILADKNVVGFDGALANPEGAALESAPRLFLVATSGHYVHQGLKVPCEIPLGAELTARAAEPHHYAGMEADHFVMHLSEIVGWTPRTEAERKAIIESCSGGVEQSIAESESKAPGVILQ